MYAHFSMRGDIIVGQYALFSLSKYIMLNSSSQIQVANNLKNGATSSVVRKYMKENNISHFFFQTYRRFCLIIKFWKEYSKTNILPHY